MHVLIHTSEILAGLLLFLGLWYVTEGIPRRRRARRPVYWNCTAGHRHETPAAAGKCSRAQTRL